MQDFLRQCRPPLLRAADVELIIRQADHDFLAVEAGRQLDVIDGDGSAGRLHGRSGDALERVDLALRLREKRAAHEKQKEEEALHFPRPFSTASGFSVRYSASARTASAARVSSFTRLPRS